MPKRSSSADPVSKYLSEIQRNLSSGIAQPGQTVHIQQGVEIKRHSQIFVHAAKQADKIVDVRVGGHAVEILEGQFSL